MANGYVRYGNSIHLDGFQILDFCIENAISLESLRDLNLGRKVFLTGNDTNAGYLRENVWDGDRWRATAYLDDLTSFKDEDFNKLKEKVDTLIGDGVDMDGIIESWKEVEAFLAGMSDTKNLMDLLNSKLDKKGGTIECPLAVGLTINSQEMESGIRFSTKGTSRGFVGANEDNTYGVYIYNSAIKYRLGIQNDGTPYYYNTQRNTLLHTGNVGEYKAGDSFRLGGYAADRYLVTQYADSDTVDLNQPLQETNRPAIVRLGGVGNHPNIPNEALQYGFLLHIGDVTKDTAWELVAGYANNSPLMFRSGTWKADGSGTIHNSDRWKTIAFTDSDITGNAATATALKNSVTLWGNTFDGTQSLSEDIILDHGKYIRFKKADNTRVLSVMNLTDNYFTLGQGAAGAGCDTYLYGRSIYFKTGESLATAMTINSSGNVTIGSSDLAGTDTRLYVNGKTSINGTLDISSILNLNRDSANYIWANKEGGYLVIGVRDVGEINSVNASLIIKEATILPGHRNNAVSLGTSSYRWSNVYSTLGDFSGRVLIGGATDDGSTALQVNGAGVFNNTIIANKYNGQGNIAGAAIVINKSGRRFGIGASSDNITSISLGLVSDEYGTWSSEHIIIESSGLTTFNGGALIPTGQKLTIGSVTFEEDAAGRVKVDGDMYATGTLASGGKAKEGTGTGSGSANVRDFELPADGKTTYDCDHLLKSKNVIVQVFEKTLQNNIEVWEMILTDVTIVTEDRVTVTFGRPHNKVHRVHIIGGNVS